MQETSAGGVVFNSNKILLLKKFNGGWVLPKGHVKKGEELSDTALREVKEETGVDAELGEYIDFIEYHYFNFREMKKSKKTVHWFLMYSDTFECVPLRAEGFKDARFMTQFEAIKSLTHSNERNIIKKAISLLED